MEIGKVNISAGFILLMSVFFYFDRNGMLLNYILAALIHEAGHFVAIKLANGRVARIALTVTGAKMTMDGSSMDYPTEVFCVLMGPVVSIAASIVGAAIGELTGLESAFAFSGISLVYGAFNILPARRLDGGRALYMLLLWKRGFVLAEKVIFAAGLISGLIASVVGLYVFLRSGYNFSLLVIGLWLFIVSVFSSDRGK